MSDEKDFYYSDVNEQKGAIARLLECTKWWPSTREHKVLKGLLAERERLRAELADAIKQRDEARRDAERYRWLKSDRCYWVEIRSQPSGDLIFQGQHGHAFWHYSGKAEMDDVIDSAMRKGKA